MQSSLTKIIEGTQTDIFNYIASAIHRFTGLPVSIWAPAGDGKGLEIISSIGLPESYVKTAYLDFKKPSVTGDAYLSNKMRIVKDINTDRRWKYKDQAREMNWKSAICVPIDADGTVVGVISVYTYTERSILELKSLLPDYAKQLALTLDAGRQRNALRQILEIESSLQSITESPKLVLDSIVKAACDLTGAGCAVAYPFDAERNEFVDIENVAAYGLLKHLKLNEKPRSKGGMASLIKRRGEVVFVNIKEQDSQMQETSSFIKREKIQAFMGITLRVSGKVLGILYVNFRTPHNFTKQEKNTIRLFAHQASNALYNANLYQQAGSQISALEKLHEAGTSLTTIPAAPTDLRDTLNRIAKSAKQVLGADLIELYQYFQSQDSYDLPPIQAGEHYYKFVIKEVYEDDVIWTIVRRKKTIYAVNTQKSKILTKPFIVNRPDRPEKRFVIREDIKSSAIIPLMAGSEVLGILFANYRSPQIFSPEQKRLIELFASQGAIAIRNARLFQELYEYMRSLNGQMQALQDVAQKQNIKDVLEQILIGINTILSDQTSASINLYNKDENTFEAYQAAGPLKDFLMKVPPRTLGSGGTGRFVIETGTSLYLDDVRKPPEHTPTIRQESIKKGICSFAALPLKRDMQVLGVLFINSQKPLIFTDGIKGILELFASQAAIAIENNQLYEQRDRNINHKQALNDLTQKLTENIGVGEEGILKLLHKSAGELMDTDNMYVALYDEQTDIVRFGLAFVNGEKVNLAKEEGWKPRKAGKGRTEEIIRTKKPILILTEKESEDWYMQRGRKEYIGNPLPSWLGVPMIVGDKVLGVIATYHPEKEYVYREDDLNILQAMANQTASALHNARLYGNTNLKLNALVDFEQAITSAIRQGESKILELIHTQASELMDTDNMYVALYDEQTDMVRFGLAFVNGRKVNLVKDERWQPRRTGKGRTEEIIRTRKSILISTRQESSEWYSQQERKDYVGNPLPSWLGVPMALGDKVLGVIATYHPIEEYVYSGEDLTILQAMANQAAVALEGARSFEKDQERIRDQETINSIAQAINMKVGTSDLLQTIVAQIQENLRCTHCAIFFPEKIDDKVALASKYTRGKLAKRIKNRRFMPGEGLAGWVFEHGESAIVPDTLQDDRYVPVREGGYVSRSLMAVPVKTNGRTVGVISIDHNEINSFDEDDCRLVETVAEHVAIALDKQKRIEILEGMQELGKSLTTETNLENLLTRVGQIAVDLLQAEMATVYQFDPNTEEFYSPVVIGSASQPLPSKDGIVSRIIKEGKIILAKDMGDNPLLNRSSFVREQGIKSCAAIPLRYGDKPTGIIFINYVSGKHYFTPNDEATVNIFADQAATAINMVGNLYNANQQLGEANQQLEKVNQQLEKANIKLQQEKEREIFAALGEASAGLIHKMSNTIGHVPALANRVAKAIDPKEEDAMRKLNQISDGVSDALEYIGGMGKVLELKGFVKTGADLDLLINDAIRQTKELIEQSAITLEEDYVDLPVVQVNPPLIIEVFRNIIHNAIEAMPDGGHLKIKSTCDSDEVTIQFTDQGSGISEEDKKQLFTLGFSTKKEGKGIGLWFSKKAIEQHQGTISVESEKDKGTTFLIRLPIGSPAPVEYSAKEVSDV